MTYAQNQLIVCSLVGCHKFKPKSQYNNNRQYNYGWQRWSGLADKSSDLVCSDICGWYCWQNWWALSWQKLTKVVRLTKTVDMNWQNWWAVTKVVEVTKVGATSASHESRMIPSTFSTIHFAMFPLRGVILGPMSSTPSFPINSPLHHTLYYNSHPPSG